MTGTELLSGRVRDRNGPWLAERLAELGVELGQLVTCGDRPRDLMAALTFLRDEEVDLIVTSGGLGPTADDLTGKVVADFAGRPLAFDEQVEQRIAEVLKGFSRRWKVDQEALRAANRKQAMVPEGAIALGPVGTAPALVVPAGEQVVVVLPGPPAELRESWELATRTDPFAGAIAAARQLRERMLRLFPIPESEIAATLRAATDELDLAGLEITTCLRRGELEVSIRNEPGSESAAEGLVEMIERRHGDTLFSKDGSSIDDQVAELLEGRRLGVGESCTGGEMAARLTQRPGASEYFAGAVVAYSDEAKAALLGVSPDLIERHGAVSEQVAEALANGAIKRFAADVGIGLTGVAGPGGGTDAKPVGRVCFCIKAHGAEPASIVRAVDVPGHRRDVRDRSTTIALHLLRRLLRGEAVPAPLRRAQRA